MSASLLAQVQGNSPAAGGTPPILTGSAREVIVDVVVRDKNQRLSRDLKPEDFEVLEDGIRQNLSSFRYISGGNGALPSKYVTGVAGKRQAYDPRHEIHLLTIVFQEMSPQGRRRATQVVADLLKNELPSNTYTGVFTLRHGMAMLQGYTSDVGLVRATAQRASRGAYSADLRKSIEEFSRLSQDPAIGGWRPLAEGDASNPGPPSDKPLAGVLAKVAALEVKSSASHKV